MEFVICQELFVDWDWERQCRFAAELGYTGMELAPFTIAKDIRDVSAETRQTMREQAEAAGVQIIGLHWLLAKTEGFHLTTADKDVRQATADYLIELGNACADFGGDLMVFGSPPQRNLQPGVTPEQAFENAAEVFRSCMPAIGERGVRICMEPLTAKETDFINTCGQAMELIRGVDGRKFGVRRDVRAMLGEDRAVPRDRPCFRDVGSGTKTIAAIDCRVRAQRRSLPRERYQFAWSGNGRHRLSAYFSGIIGHELPGLGFRRSLRLLARM